MDTLCLQHDMLLQYTFTYLSPPYIKILKSSYTILSWQSSSVLFSAINQRVWLKTAWLEDYVEICLKTTRQKLVPTHEAREFLRSNDNFFVTEKPILSFCAIVAPQNKQRLHGLILKWRVLYYLSWVWVIDFDLFSQVNLTMRIILCNHVLRSHLVFLFCKIIMKVFLK